MVEGTRRSEREITPRLSLRVHRASPTQKTRHDSIAPDAFLSSAEAEYGMPFATLSHFHPPSYFL